MSATFVECSECGEVSAAVEWGFVLLARHGWSAELADTEDPKWSCPACNEKLAAFWDADTDVDMVGPHGQPRRLRVLLVDDQLAVLRATASMLHELDVVTVGSAAEALKRLAEGSHFDVVVSDVSMPGMSGPELFIRIRDRYPRLADRVLLVSGDAYGAELLCKAVARREGLERIPRILTKPVPRNELVRAVHELGRRSTPRSGTFALDQDELAPLSQAK